MSLSHASRHRDGVAGFARARSPPGCSSQLTPVWDYLGNQYLYFPTSHYLSLDLHCPALPWGVKYFPLQDKLSFVSTCTARWVFAGLLTSSFPRSRAGAAGALSGGKSNRNLSITQLCPFCGQWAFCAGIPSVISELFFSHYLCFG